MPEIHFTTSSCCFQICFFIHLYLGKWSNLTNYLSNGLVQPPTRFRCREFIAICPALNLGGYQLGLEAGCTFPPIHLGDLLFDSRHFAHPNGFGVGILYRDTKDTNVLCLYYIIKFTKRFFERLFATNWLIHFDGKAYDVMSFSNVFHSCVWKGAVKPWKMCASQTRRHCDLFSLYLFVALR